MCQLILTLTVVSDLAAVQSRHTTPSVLFALREQITATEEIWNRLFPLLAKRWKSIFLSFITALKIYNLPILFPHTTLSKMLILEVC